MTEEYSEEEKVQIRRQLREATRLAREAALRHGAKVHPRIVAAKLSKLDE